MVDDAIRLDGFAGRYGWTEQQVLSTRQVMLDLLPEVWRSQRESRGQKQSQGMIANLWQQVQRKR